MNSSSKIDRKCIAEAVSPAHEPLLDFSAGCVLPNEISLSSINLVEIGNINLPLSLLDAERLKVFSEKQFDAVASPTLFPSPQRHTFEICSDTILSSTLENIDISSVVIKMLGLPVTKSMNFKAKLDKLMLFEVDGQYTHTFHSGKEFGTFGTAILQLPVNGGHDGGNFRVEYNGRQSSFEDHRDCDQLFFLSSFYNSCECIMNPVTRGWKLTLVFDLVWTNSSIVMPADFLVFLSSQKKLESALLPWSPQRNEDDYSTEVQQCPLLKEDVQIPVITSVDEKKVACSTDQPPVIALNDSSDNDVCSLNKKKEDTDIEDSEYSENDDYSENESDSEPTRMMKQCEEEDVLFFVLEEKYFENSLMFHHLQGNDRILADLLRCCPFIDVHLAKVTYVKPKLRARRTQGGRAPCPIGSRPSEEKSPIKISRWIGSDGVHKDLKIDELNWSERCVGPIRNLLEPCSIDTDRENLNSTECQCQKTCRCCGEDDINRFHAILVIWPKHQSVEMYCRYGFGMLLNDLEISLTSALGWQTLTQQQLAQDLNKTVKYCCTYPQRIWTQSTFRNGELTLRLLRLCITLRAQKEGLEILKILGSEFEIKKKKKTLKTFEGIQNEQVAQAIVQFVCQSNGWGGCIDLIRRLLTTYRIIKQFVPITKMIQYFLDVKCVKGAMLVGDCVASLMANIDQKRVSFLNQSGVALYVVAIVSLESYPEASSQERLASLVSVFSKLSSTLQCRLVVELDALVNSRFMGIESCQLIFLKISETFISSQLRVPSADVFGLLKCSILRGNPKWLESLLSKMIPDQLERIVLLTKLVSDQALLKLAKSSELGKKSLVFILNRCSALLFSELSPSNEVSRSRHHSYEHTLRSSLAEYLQFVLEMEHTPELADPHRLSSISLLLSKMDFEQLWHILDGFHKSSSENWNTSPCYSDMMREICKSMVSAMKKSRVMQRRYAVSNMVRGFLHFLENSLSQSLLMEVCVIEAAGKWCHNSKYKFFSDIISSTEVWGKLDPHTKLDILNTCATLIESLIIKECNTLNDKSWIQKTQEDARYAKFSSLAQFFFLIEEHRFDPKQKNIIGSFQPYLKKLPRLVLRSFMLKFHKSIVKNKPCVKEFPLGLELFITVCRHFVDQNFLSDKLSEEEGDKIVNCLLFIDDARSWERFADGICSFQVIADHNQPFQRTLLNANIQETIAKSPLASAAFIRVADHWETGWKLVKNKFHRVYIEEWFHKLTSEMDDVLKFRQSLSRNLAAAKPTGKRPLESVSSSTSSDEVRILSSKRSKP